MNKIPEKNKKKQELIENIDYYIENGLWVFTAKYHLDRGYCCQNGCRHCPYGFERNKDLYSN
jgi:hypothetical protein